MLSRHEFAFSEMAHSHQQPSPPLSCSSSSTCHPCGQSEPKKKQRRNRRDKKHVGAGKDGGASAAAAAGASTSATGSKNGDPGRRHSEPRSHVMDKKQQLYKTELCRNWQEQDHCRYGDKCQYAHGPEDLRQIERHPKYKTQVCRTYQKTGSCPYGKRCTFRHLGEDDLPSNPESLLPLGLLKDLELPSPPATSPSSVSSSMFSSYFPQFPRGPLYL